MTSQDTVYYVGIVKKNYTTVQVARLLGVGRDTIYRWLRQGKIPSAKVARLGNVRVRLWTERDIAKIRQYMKQNPYQSRGRKRKTKA